MQVIDYDKKPLYVVFVAGGKSFYKLKNINRSSVGYAESKNGFDLLAADVSSLLFFDENGLLVYHMDTSGTD